MDARREAGRQRLEQLQPEYDAFWQRTRDNDISGRWTGVAVGAGVFGVMGGVIGLAGGAGLAGRLRAGAIGLGAGALLAGSFFALAVFDPDSRAIYHRPRAKTPEERKLVDAYAAAQDDARILPFEWEVGGSSNRGMPLHESVRSFTQEHAASFDHDGDGFVDLSADSPELARDARNGGPVSAATRGLLHLSRGFRDSDGNGDGRLSVEEAVRATVQAGIDRDTKPFRSSVDPVF